MVTCSFGDPVCTGHVILRMRSKVCSLNNGKTLFFAYNVAYSSSYHPESDKVSRQIGVRDF